jgi:LytS/YehU family sensor histidine kinase
MLSVVAGVLFQTAIATRIRISGAKPDAVGAVAIALGLLMGPAAGAAGGFLGGLSVDLVNSRFVGLYALTRALMGVAGGLATGKIFKENLLMTGAIGFFATMVAESAGAMIISLNGVKMDAAASLNIAGIVALFSLITTPVVFYMIWRAKVRVDSSQSQVIVE